MSKLKNNSALILATLAGLLLVAIVTPQTVLAHPGRTDANGGHNCYVGSCAGTYHYHNGGGSYSQPTTTNYVTQGLTNGKAHAARDEAAIREKTKTTGYQAGYNSGYGGGQKTYYASVPDSICDVTFTFDAGTDETYKTWYTNGYTTACNDIARTEYDPGYQSGYTAGQAAKPQPVETISSSADSEESGGALWGWAILGGIFGLPLLGAGWESIKKYFE